MKTLALIILLSGFVPESIFAQTSLTDIQQSHIEANVPASAHFTAFLERDLLDYFQKQGFPAATSVSFTLLRNGPTQTGISYPKFYLWVDVHEDKKVVTQGAICVAAVEQSYFRVTRFLPSSKIRVSPEAVSSIFPAPLVSTIVSRAKAVP